MKSPRRARPRKPKDLDYAWMIGEEVYLASNLWAMDRETVEYLRDYLTAAAQYLKYVEGEKK